MTNMALNWVNKVQIRWMDEVQLVSRTDQTGIRYGVAGDNRMASNSMLE